MKPLFVYSEAYRIGMAGLEKLHPFDINKYSSIHGRLMNEGIISAEDVISPEAVTDEQLRLVHTQEFMAGLKDASTVARFLEASWVAMFPLALLERCVLTPLRYATGGTIVACRQALQRKSLVINLGGGFHHAKPFQGEGFCVFADMPIAISVLRKEKLVKRVLVVDLDVHQGNGTALCCAKDEDTYTFSMHQEDLYPIPKERSTVDVSLSVGTNDEEYLSLLEKHLPKVLREAQAELVIYQAGCDPVKGDPLASLAMSAKGIQERDRYVIESCRERNIPVAMTLGGGYAKDAWLIQFQSIRELVTQ